MKTFLVDLHGGLAELRLGLPFLYPYRADEELELLPGSGQPRDLREMAESVRVSMLRDYQPRLQLVFLIDLTQGPLVEQIDRVRRDFVGTLAAQNLFPSRVVVVSVDTVVRALHTGVPRDDAARRVWAKDAQVLGSRPEAGVEGTVVLRFPLQRTPPPVFHQHLVQLAYLVAVLVELFQADEQIGHERLYLVDQVALDAAEIRAWLAEYEGCLAQARENVVHQLDHPEPVPLGLIENPNCGCAGVLEPPELAARTFGWLRHHDDSSVWLRWWQDTGTLLEGHARTGDALVRRCLKEWRARVFEVTERVVDAIADLAAELRERLERARRVLARPSRTREEPVDWEEEMQRMTPRVRALIEARPRPRAFAIFTAALLPLLVAPMLMTLPPVEAYRMLPAALLLLAAGSLVAWVVLAVLRNRLHLATHAALERAQEISKHVAEQVDARKRHLAALCAVEVARRNDAEAQEAYRGAGLRMLLLKFHRDQLADHRRLGETFARTQASAFTATGPAAQPPDAGEGRRLTAGWRIDLPPHRNPAYAPALCTGSLTEQPFEVRIRAGARVIRRTSTRLRGLQHLLLVDDIIYQTPVDDTPE